jgi:hypothetical protein
MNITKDITKAQYMTDIVSGSTSNIYATIGGIKMCVPLDPDNTDYAAILEWVEDGNTIEDAD